MIFHGQNNDIATIESEERCESNFHNIKSYFCNVMTLENHIRYKNKAMTSIGILVLKMGSGIEDWFLACVFFLW